MLSGEMKQFSKSAQLRALIPALRLQTDLECLKMTAFVPNFSILPGPSSQFDFGRLEAFWQSPSETINLENNQLNLNHLPPPPPHEGLDSIICQKTLSRT